MPTKQKSVLVIGVGSIGERHLRCFQRTGRVALGICETNDALRGRIAERYGVERQFATLTEALTGRFDAAVIATPAHLHIPMALEAAQAGMHLLIEKPLSTSLEGVDALQACLAEQGLVAAVAYVLRCHPSLAAMRAAVASGRFGRPLQLVTNCGQHFPTYRPAYREIYYRDRRTGGGAIQDALAHHVNAAEWLVGPVQRLVVDAAHQALPGVEVEDTIGLLARHGDVLATYSLNQHQAPNEVTTTVVCEGGTVRWELHHQHWQWMDRPETSWHEEPAGPLERDDMFVAQASAFLDAMAGDRPPVCTLDEGLQTQRAILAALRSAASSQWGEV